MVEGRGGVEEAGEVGEKEEQAGEYKEVGY